MTHDEVVSACQRVLELTRARAFGEAEEELRAFAFDAAAAMQLKKHLEASSTLVCEAAARPGSAALIAVLAELGAKVDTYCGGDHILACCVQIDNPHSERMVDEFVSLIRAGANPNAIALGGGTLPLLHYCIDWGRLDFVELLLINGADLNHRSELGWTALEFARKRGKTSAIKLLEKWGAK